MCRWTSLGPFTVGLFAGIVYLSLATAQTKDAAAPQPGAAAPVAMQTAWADLAGDDPRHAG